MLSLRYLTRLSSPRTYRPCIALARHFHDESTKDPSKTLTHSNDKLRTTTPAVSTKFNVFSDDNATVILDVDEERQRMFEDVAEKDDLFDSAYSGLNLESTIFWCNIENWFYRLIETLTLSRRCNWRLRNRGFSWSFETWKWTRYFRLYGTKTTKICRLYLRRNWSQSTAPNSISTIRSEIV